MKKPDLTTLLSLTVLLALTASVVGVFTWLGSQPSPLQYGVILPLAYLLGSLPCGYVLLRWRRGVDIREYGSGRTGVSNVLRTAGGPMAALVLFLDTPERAPPHQENTAS